MMKAILFLKFEIIKHSHKQISAVLVSPRNMLDTWIIEREGTGETFES